MADFISHKEVLKLLDAGGIIQSQNFDDEVILRAIKDTKIKPVHPLTFRSMMKKKEIELIEQININKIAIYNYKGV